MKIEEIIDQVHTDQLYAHVRQLEGIRHPIDALDNLNRAGDYFSEKLSEFGLKVREQEFKIRDFPATFRNIEGLLGNENEPSTVLVSHYDTVYNSPGANDNASGNSLMLELARILSKEGVKKSIRFLFATIEEWNPASELKYREIAQKHGIIDEELKFTSYEYSKLQAQFSSKVAKYHNSGKRFSKAVAKAIKKMNEPLPENIQNFMKEYKNLYPDKSAFELIGEKNLIGSAKWVEEALNIGKKIKMVFCLDELGTVIKKPHSQTIPSNLGKDIFQTYKVNIEQGFGDFIFILTTPQVKNIVDDLCKYFKSEDINLSHACFINKFPLEVLYQIESGLLGSDHANFFKAGIPGISFTDTANERNPYHHTPADTIDKIDFDQVAKIGKSVLATLINLV